MTRHRKQKSPARLLKSLYIWHRYIGLAAALFVILLAITGIALNHTGNFELDKRFVRSDALLDWYGVHAPDDITAYRAGSTVISEVGNHIYRDNVLVEQATPPLLGALAFPDLVVIGTQGRLLLFTPEGEFVEQLGGAAGVPAGMQAIGVTGENELAIHAAHGYYRTDSDFLEWRETDTLDADWAQPVEVPADLKRALQEAYRGSGLTLERILLDLHSGRILGEWGIYLMDAAAILFILLAFSGVWLWAQRKSSAREHRRKLEHPHHE